MEYDKALSIFAAHSHRLGADIAHAANDLELSLEQERQLASLWPLEERVKFALSPVHVPASFARKLEVDLIGIARQRRSNAAPVVEPSSTNKWLLGALVALVGGIAYWWHAHSRPERDLPAHSERPFI